MVRAMSDSSVNRLIGRLIGRAALYHDSTFPVARFGGGSENEGLKYRIDPAMEVFHGRIVRQDQIHLALVVIDSRGRDGGTLTNATGVYAMHCSKRILFDRFDPSLKTSGFMRVLRT